MRPLPVLLAGPTGHVAACLRRMALTALLAANGWPAWAEQPVPPPAASVQTDPVAQPAAVPQTPSPKPPSANTNRARSPHLTAKQRFEKANTTGDGKLTLEQAKAGYTSIARHFQQIDADHKGYVTQDDIKTWRKATRDARRHAKQADNDPLRPRAAYQRSFVDPRPVTPTAIIGPQRQAEQPSTTETAQAAPTDK